MVDYNEIILFQTQRTLFNKPFDRAVIEVTPDYEKYDWLVKLPNDYVNKSTEIPREKLETLKVSSMRMYSFFIIHN